MESSLHSGQITRKAPRLARQALSFFLHTLLALASWIALMLVGYAVNPAGISQSVILVLSMAVPLLVGLVVAKIHPSEMATAVWLVGLIWVDDRGPLRSGFAHRTGTVLSMRRDG